MPVGINHSARISQISDSGGSAIPDNLVDNFNDVDADPAGIYESGTTVETYYQNNGNDNDIVRSTSEAREGSHGLTIAATNTTAPSVWSVPGDGLNAYPQPGDTIRWFGKDAGGGGVVALAQVADATNPGCYGFEFDEGAGSIDIWRFDDISADQATASRTNLSNSSASVSNGVWYWCAADLSSPTDNSIAYRIYELNADNTRGSQIASTSTTDSTYDSARGVGMSTISGNSGTSIDDIQIK